MDKTGVDVREHLARVTPAKRRADAEVMLELMGDITGWEPEMWSSGIIGFGTCRYTYPTRTTGLSGILGFAPRKSALTVYVFEGFDDHAEALAKLGPHTTSVSCLYITDLSKIDLAVLRGILERSLAWMLDCPSDAVQIEVLG